MAKIKKFRINVNGVDHIVEVEELSSVSAPAAAPVVLPQQRLLRPLPLPPHQRRLPLRPPSPRRLLPAARPLPRPCPATFCRSM